jgi:two-component system LytT family response regulator
MKVVIVEDEFVAAQNLSRMIQEVDGSTEILAVLQSVEESVEWFSINLPRCGFYGYSFGRW